MVVCVAVGALRLALILGGGVELLANELRLLRLVWGLLSSGLWVVAFHKPATATTHSPLLNILNSAVAAIPKWVAAIPKWAVVTLNSALAATTHRHKTCPSGLSLPLPTSPTSDRIHRLSPINAFWCQPSNPKRSVPQSPGALPTLMPVPMRGRLLL